MKEESIWSLLSRMKALPDTIVFSLLAICGVCAAGAANEKKIDFAHEIVPILKEHCGECHTGDKRKGGFSMNTRALLLQIV